MSDDETHAVAWFPGSYARKDGGSMPCLLSWVNGCPLVVPLLPAFARSERAEFLVEGHYEGSAGDIEEACEHAVKVALFAECDGRTSAYPPGQEGIERFFREWNGADPVSLARDVAAAEAQRILDGVGSESVLPMGYPEGALAESPLSKASAALREAAQAKALDAMPGPEAFEGHDAELVRIANLVRATARHHPEGDSLRLMADKSALRMFEAVRGEADRDEAANLLAAVAGLLLKVDGKGRDRIDRDAFDAAISFLETVQAPGAPSGP